MIKVSVTTCGTGCGVSVWGKVNRKHLHSRKGRMCQSLPAAGGHDTQLRVCSCHVFARFLNVSTLYSSSCVVFNRLLMKTTIYVHLKNFHHPSRLKSHLVKEQVSVCFTKPNISLVNNKMLLNSINYILNWHLTAQPKASEATVLSPGLKEFWVTCCAAECGSASGATCITYPRWVECTVVICVATWRYPATDSSYISFLMLSQRLVSSFPLRGFKNIKRPLRPHRPH